MQEQGLGLTGMVDERTAANLGGILGVHEIVIGKITDILYVPERTRSKQISQTGTIRVASGTETYTDSSGKVKTRTKYVDKMCLPRLLIKQREFRINQWVIPIIDAQTAAIKREGQVFLTRSPNSKQSGENTAGTRRR